MLDDGGVRLAAPLTHGLQPVPAASALKLMQELGGQHRTRRAERMAECDGTAVWIGLFKRCAGVGGPREQDRRERFVHFEDVDVTNAQASLAEHVLGGGD